MIQYFLDNPDKSFTILAIIAAAGFFGWKIIAGWLIVNLEIVIETERKPKDKTHDWLGINLLLKKGSTDGLWLKDVALRIKTFDGEKVNEVIRFEEFNSIKIVNQKLNWEKHNTNPRKFTIAPGETFCFGRVEIVPFDKPLIIEAAVFGKRAFWPKGFQWRTSCFSLTCEKSDKFTS